MLRETFTSTPSSISGVIESIRWLQESPGKPKIVDLLAEPVTEEFWLSKVGLYSDSPAWPYLVLWLTQRFHLKHMKADIFNKNAQPVLANDFVVVTLFGNPALCYVSPDKCEHHLHDLEESYIKQSGKQSAIVHKMATALHKGSQQKSQVAIHLKHSRSVNRALMDYLAEEGNYPVELFIYTTSKQDTIVASGASLSGVKDYVESWVEGFKGKKVLSGSVLFTDSHHDVKSVTF